MSRFDLPNILYFVCCVLLLGTMFVARFVLASKLGRILVATRDKEDRVRFSGYDVANYKIFVFCLASAMAGVGGAMFTLQVGFMSPSFVGIVPSIDMVIFCAVGGRNSIVGAVAGTLLVNWAKTMFSEAFPELWLFAMGVIHRRRRCLSARHRRRDDRPDHSEVRDKVPNVERLRWCSAERGAGTGRIGERSRWHLAPISCSRSNPSACHSTASKP